MWPNFFIVGASKSGTTSLYEYLKKISGIYMSPIKEPNYFHGSTFKIMSRRINDKSEYLKLFKFVTNEKAVGEASTSYLQEPESAKLIHDQVPDAKIIIILRDPCQRIFSGYLMFKSERGGKRSFHELIKTDPGFLESSLYYYQVKRYLDIFGSKQVKVLIFEEFIKEPKAAIKEILDFLKVNYDLPENIKKIYNPYSVPRAKFFQKILTSKTISKISDQILPQSFKWKLKNTVILKNEKKPSLSNQDRIFLQNFYRDDVMKLQNLLKRRLPWKWIEREKL